MRVCNDRMELKLSEIMQSTNIYVWNNLAIWLCESQIRRLVGWCAGSGRLNWRNDAHFTMKLRWKVLPKSMYMHHYTLMGNQNVACTWTHRRRCDVRWKTKKTAHFGVSSDESICQVKICLRQSSVLMQIAILSTHRHIMYNQPNFMCLISSWNTLCTARHQQQKKTQFEWNASQFYVHKEKIKHTHSTSNIAIWHQLLLIFHGISLKLSFCKKKWKKPTKFNESFMKYSF